MAKLTWTREYEITLSEKKLQYIYEDEVEYGDERFDNWENVVVENYFRNNKEIYWAMPNEIKQQFINYAWDWLEKNHSDSILLNKRKS